MEEEIVRLSEAMDWFLTTKRVNGRAEKTLEQYEYVLNRFGQYLGRDPNIRSISPDRIRGLLGELMRDDYSKSTVAIFYRVLQAFFNWVEKEGLISDSPVDIIEEPKTPKQFPRILEEEEVEKLIRQAESRPRNWFGIRNYAILLTFLDMGLRRQELCDAKLDNLYLRGKNLKVNGKGSKDRRVFFGDKTQIGLRKWLKRRNQVKSKIKHDTIFVGRNGTKLKGRNLTSLIKRMGQRAGLDSKVSPHVLRHTAATMAVKNGLDTFSLRRNSDGRTWRQPNVTCTCQERGWRKRTRSTLLWISLGSSLVRKGIGMNGGSGCRGRSG